MALQPDLLLLVAEREKNRHDYVRRRADPDTLEELSSVDERGAVASLAVRFTGAREAQARAGEGAILFFPDGGSTGGRVTLASGRAAWSVDVGWLTGEVRLLRDEVRAR